MNDTDSTDLSALADELIGLARHDPGRLSERVSALTVRQQAELALMIPPHERLKLLLHAPRPMRLVRALPEPEFHMTVREIGPTESLRLVALASAAQLHHLVDLESWRGDRFDADRSGAWVALMLEAGEPAIKRFLRTADDDLLGLLFQRWLRVGAIELDEDVNQHGSGHTEIGDETGLVSPDGSYRLSPTIAEHSAAVQRLMQIFFLDQPERYQRIMWASLYELPAEIEEKALFWRQSRLEELGYPPWEEALAVYAPPLGVRTHSETPQPTDADGLGAPRTALRLLSPEEPLTLALGELPDDLRERALHELFAVSSRLIVADGADTGEPESHRGALRKAAAYVGIALEKRGGNRLETLREAVSEVPLIELFREGHAEAVRLQHQARSMSKAGWAAAHPRAFELLDAPLDGRLAGVLEHRPLYLEAADEIGEGRLRPFQSLQEIEETRLALDMANAVARLFFERLGLDLAQVLTTAERSGHDVRFSTLLLTLLAWHAARNELRGEPLPDDVVADFLRNVASRRTATPDAPARALDSLVGRLSDGLEMETVEVALIRSFGRAALERLNAECAALDPGVPADPRYVSCLLLK